MKQHETALLEPLTQRFLEFVDNNGGPSEVARLVGGKPAFIYLLRSGKNRRPNLETLERMAQAYPHFDRHYIETGATSQTRAAQLPPGQTYENDVTALLRAELVARDAMIEQLKKENERVWNLVEPKKPKTSSKRTQPGTSRSRRSFQTFSNQETPMQRWSMGAVAEDRPNPIGFGWSQALLLPVVGSPATLTVGP